MERLLAMDVIERIDASPWVSPIMVTLRKNGKPRMCVDLREPNKAVVMDSHPLPHMDDLFSEMRGAIVFSTIDLANAYHQVLLAEESRDMTSFITLGAFQVLSGAIWTVLSTKCILQAHFPGVERPQGGPELSG